MNKHFRNIERLADIDEGTLWTASNETPGVFTLADQDDCRQIGPGWDHIMKPVPDPVTNEN